MGRVRIDYLFLALAILMASVALRSQTQVSVKQVNASYIVTSLALCVEPPELKVTCNGMLLAEVLDVKKNETKQYVLTPMDPRIPITPVWVKEVLP